MHADNDTTPVEIKTICNICSVGCSLMISAKHGGIVKVNGTAGLVNPEGDFCTYPATAMDKINKLPRITKPLLRKNGTFEPILWQEALDLISNEIKGSTAEEMAFFAGARLSNEEQYLIQKLARAGAKTNNIGSFHYLGREMAYARLTKANLPFPELELTSHAYLIGADIPATHPVLANFIAHQQTDHGCKVTAISEGSEITGPFKSKTLAVGSIYYFIKAVNHYILTGQLEDHLFLGPLIGNFEEYRAHLLGDPFEQLIKRAGVAADVVHSFATNYMEDKAAVLIFSENNSGAQTCAELFNLACISGKHGKTGSGLMLLKEKNNAHGLYDMGVMPQLSPGADDWSDPTVRQRFQEGWRSDDMPVGEGVTLKNLGEGKFKRLFIFGEDPVGCAYEPEQFKQAVSRADFSVVQDYVFTPTAELAHLVLPASWPWENGGTYTNTQKVLQNTGVISTAIPEMASWQQLNTLLDMLNAGKFESIDDIMFEIASLFPRFCSSSKLCLRLTREETFVPLFRAGADMVSALSARI